MSVTEQFSLGDLDPTAEMTPIAMRDGVVLHGDLYRATTAAQCPAILIRLPYGTARGYTYMPQVARYLADRGFHVLVQDVRGRFRSEGERTPMVHEREDGWDTIDWIAAQQWCSGAVGMIGTSYYGFTQWAAAASGHPALKAIVPRYTAQIIPASVSFARDAALLMAPDAMDWIVGIWSTETMIETADLGLDFLNGPLRDAIPETLPNARRILHERLDEGEEAFVGRVYPDGLPASQLRIPALHVAGWWDNCKPMQMPDWDEVASQAPARDHQFLHVAGTDHRDLRFSLSGRAEEDHLHGDDAALARYLPRMLELPIAFFDHYLRHGEGVWPGPRVRYELVNAGWREADSWPPRVSELLTLRLHEGSLLKGAQTPSTTVTWTHDPEKPVPSLSPNEFEFLAEIPDESIVHARADVAVFTAAPCEVPLDVAGRAEVDVAIESDGASADVIATLCDVAPDGRAWMIAEGAVRLRTGAGPVRAEVTLGDVAYRVPSGHRLRLVIASSRFPRYAVNPGTGADQWESGERRATRQTLHLDDHAVLRLPLTAAEADA